MNKLNSLKSIFLWIFIPIAFVIGIILGAVIGYQFSLFLSKAG
jgi:putative flippase GtrA